MRILIDPGTYNCLNLGDMAMLQVAVNRLERLVPSATLQVITDTPEALARYCPNARPVSATAFRAWFQDNVLLQRGQRYCPLPLISHLVKGKRYIRRRSPRLLRHFLALARPLNIRRADLDAFVEAVYAADCVITCGQGFLTDHVGIDALTKLNLLAAAKAENIPFIMLGQGIGPLTDKMILNLARTVLPGVEVLSLRERVAGIALCQSMQIPSTRCLVTGDEAVELAWTQRRSGNANGVGINVRLSPSSRLSDSVLPSIARALNQFANGRQIQYVPLPIARDHSLRDVSSIRQLLRIAGYESNGGMHLDTPDAVIKEVAKCRIVLTGAYHAAVFALSQGIPTVCIANSDYFRVKFEGLADQFGEGCVVVAVGQPHFIEHLVERLTQAWESAPRLQTSLRNVALLQILKSYRAYNRVGRILQRRIPEAEIHYLTPPLLPMRECAKAAGLCHD